MADNQIVICLSAVITSYKKLKDKSFVVIVETGELGSEQLLGLDLLTQKAVFLALGENPIEYDDIKEQLPDVLQADPRKGKTSASRRLRAVLYRYREQFERSNHSLFDNYYEITMEKLIKHYKEKLG